MELQQTHQCDTISTLLPATSQFPMQWHRDTRHQGTSPGLGVSPLNAFPMYPSACSLHLQECISSLPPLTASILHHSLCLRSLLHPSFNMTP